MSRVGIFVGEKEVVKRYVGDELVWEKKKEEIFWIIGVGNTYYPIFGNSEKEIGIRVSSNFSQNVLSRFVYLTINGRRVDKSEMSNYIKTGTDTYLISFNNSILSYTNGRSVPNDSSVKFYGN